MDDSELRDLARDCVHCGFCLPACPTYSLWGEEMDSPRGRIHLMTQVLDGEELSTAAAEHFDRCLGCMACMTACPSGVQYDRLIEAARAWTDDPEHAPPVQPEAHLHEVAGADGPDEAPETGGAGGWRLASVALAGFARRWGWRGGRGPAGGVPVGGGRHRPFPDRAARAAIFAVFPYPRRLRALTGPLRALQRTGLDRLVARSGLPAKVSPTLGAAMNLAPQPGPPMPKGRLPGTGHGPRRAAGRGRHAHRLRAVGVLPARQPGHRPGAGGRGLRRGHPPRAGLLRGAVAALGPGRGGGGLRPGGHRDVRAGRRGSDRGQLGGLRFGHEGVRQAAGRRPGLGRPGRGAERQGPRLLRVPGRTVRAGGRPGRGPASGAGRGRLPRRLPPGPRAADHRRAARAAARHPRTGAAGDPGGRDVLRLGGRLQPAAAGGGERAGPAESRFGADHRGPAADFGQPRLLAADRLGAGGPG